MSRIALPLLAAISLTLPGCEGLVEFDGFRFAEKGVAKSTSPPPCVIGVDALKDKDHPRWALDTDTAESVTFGPMKMVPLAERGDWLEGDRAPLLSCSIDGDFSFVTRFALLQVEGSDTPPASEFHGAGIMLQRDDQPSSWQLFNYGFQKDSRGVQLWSQSPSENAAPVPGTFSAENVGGNTLCLALCRVGPDLRLLWDYGSVNWPRLDRLGSAPQGRMRVGITAHRHTKENLIAGFGLVEIARPKQLGECLSVLSQIGPDCFSKPLP
jgi:hypothetical protein